MSGLPDQHWLKLKTVDPLERIMRKVKGPMRISIDRPMNL